MDPLHDLLVDRAGQLDVGRRDELSLIQVELDRLFKRGVWARQLDHNKHILTIEVEDSSLASIVRLSQVQVLAGTKNLTREPIEKLLIRIQ